MKRFAVMIAASGILVTGLAQRAKTFTLTSPDQRVVISITAGATLAWAVQQDGMPVTQPSPLGLELQSGEILGSPAIVTHSATRQVNESISAVAYKKARISNRFNELVLDCRGNYAAIFRAYDNAVAFRFEVKRGGDMIIRAEKTAFHFSSDDTAWIPHTSDLRDGERYCCSFEEFYTRTPLSKFNPDTLGYLPLLVEWSPGRKAALLESDVQDYPAMFVHKAAGVPWGLEATHAPYPLEEALGKQSRINYLPTRRADFIAKTKGSRLFPWRIMVLSRSDRELLNNDIVQQLAAPCAIKNTDWIKPGKVAWDWWNDWNISHVDFKAGINTETYKYYIDFAAANKLEYVVLDEGWSDDWDLTKLSNSIDLPALLAHAKEKNVGLILWSTWYALTRDPVGLCARYAAMGVKGFKVDFLDRNDQKVIASCYELARIAADHHLLLDFHGMFPPQGLQRTWPNVVNFEGVRGLEYSKWHPDDRVPAHDASLPFIRMLAGPMDYTPGAMRNVTKGNAHPSNSLPVSLGTRCHQLGLYIVYEAPLQMLCDNPTAYQKEKECTGFIAACPTVFDTTIALDGVVGEFAVIARKKGNTWYIGGINNWNERDIKLDLSFLGNENYSATIFQDGVNANRDATDYRKVTKIVSGATGLDIHLAPGGGFALQLTK